MTTTTAPTNTVETAPRSTSESAFGTDLSDWAVDGPSQTRVLNRALHQCDRFVVELLYVDSKGQRTFRTVSPIRFCNATRFLALCLCREQPRQFHLKQCQALRLIPAAEVIMPVTIRTIA
ncbi:MAG: hypothetical protein AAGD07_19840 [Planctomycetota bacterium]